MSEAPDYFEPIMGVREWPVDEEGYLHSLTGKGDRWEPGEEQAAKCLRPHYGALISVIGARFNPVTGVFKLDEPEEEPKHEAPTKGCMCGLYAWYDRDCAEEHGDGPLGMQRVRGVVSARGRVVLSEYGFKAEYMKLEAIVAEEATVALWGATVGLKGAHRVLARRYGVPLIEPGEVAAFCEERGAVLAPDPLPEEESPHVLARHLSQQVITSSHIWHGSLSPMLHPAPVPPPPPPPSFWARQLVPLEGRVGFVLDLLHCLLFAWNGFFLGRSLVSDGPWWLIFVSLLGLIVLVPGVVRMWKRRDA